MNKTECLVYGNGELFRLGFYTYQRATRERRENITAKVFQDVNVVTICAIDVDLLICGIRQFPCEDGKEYHLDDTEYLEILTFVQGRRNDLKKEERVKTLKGWNESGLGSFEEYFSPGDLISEAVVTRFLNILPPTIYRSGYLQAGGAFSSVRDSEGKCRETYTTFHLIEEGIWMFDGYCFADTTGNMVEQPDRLARKISEFEGRK